jgi:hypothetical protein
MKETPCNKNAMNVIAIPNAKVLTALSELKFSLLILHRSAMAPFVVVISLSAFCFARNLSSRREKMDGNLSVRFAENTNRRNQKANVGSATRITAIPIKLLPL